MGIFANPHVFLQPKCTIRRCRGTHGPAADWRSDDFIVFDMYSPHRDTHACWLRPAWSRVCMQAVCASRHACIGRPPLQSPTGTVAELLVTHLLQTLCWNLPSDSLQELGK